MKYTVYGYNQNRLMEHELDGNDALLLKTIMDIYSSSSEKLSYILVDEEKYVWLTYKYISQEIPVLGSVRTIMRKIDNLIKKEILKKVVVNSKNGNTGTYMYLAPGKNYSSFLDWDFKKQEEENNFVCPVTDCHGDSDKVEDPSVTKCHTKDPFITNPSIIIKKNNTHRAHGNVSVIEDILKKYRECNLPDFEFAPKNHVIMECLNTLGAEKLFKAFEMMKESSFVKNNFSVNMVFNVENLKKALNGSFKDRVISKTENKISSHLLLHDKVYDDNEEYEEMMRKLGLSD